jgi:plasmid stabilization system protein ParE
VTYRIVVQPAAERDFDQAADWYEDVSPGLGAEFFRSVEVALAQIERMPEAHPLVFRGARRVMLHRFPFALYYCVSPPVAAVFACQHTRWETWRWMGRLGAEADG